MLSSAWMCASIASVAQVSTGPTVRSASLRVAARAASAASSPAAWQQVSGGHLFGIDYPRQEATLEDEPQS